MDQFAQRLREIRGSMTQTEFSALTGISRASISNYENGLRTPDITALRQLHEATGVSVYYLLGITDTRDDALVSAQRETGLESCALQRMEENPLCVKVVNHLLGSQDADELIRLAATIHDDFLAQPAKKPEGWSELETMAMVYLREEQRKLLQELIWRIMVTPRKDDAPMGVNPDALPCNINNQPSYFVGSGFHYMAKNPLAGMGGIEQTEGVADEKTPEP